MMTPQPAAGSFHTLFNVTLFSSEGSETKTTREISWSFLFFGASRTSPPTIPHRGRIESVGAVCDRPRANAVRPYNHAPR